LGSLEEKKMRPWSYSRLSTWETCPKQYWYSYKERMAGFRPESPSANRGSDLHDKADRYLKGELNMYPPEFQRVSTHLMGLKAKHALSEQKIAANVEWAPCDYESPDAYFRAIIDVLYVDTNEKYVSVQDHKSGQIYPEHVVQMSDYVAVVAAHYPEYQFRTQLIYIDQGIVTMPKIIEPDRVKPIRLMLDGRIKNAEDDTIWPTKPGSHCGWCDYSIKYGGPCPFTGKRN